MDKDAIRKLEDQRFKAMVDADAATLDKLLADSLVYTHSYGGSDGKASYLDGIRSKKWHYRKIERTKENIQVHGDCAVVTGQIRIDLLSEGKPKTLNSAYTNVWIQGA